MASVGFFVQDMRGGRAERSVVRLANGMAAAGVKTALVLMQAKGPFMAEVAAGVEIVDLGARRTAFGHCDSLVCRLPPG